jgi:hypothetical protein
VELKTTGTTRTKEGATKEKGKFVWEREETERE